MKCFNDYNVNITTLKNNANNIKSKVGASVKFCAVVKANAYGMGIDTAVKELSGIADFFACACVKEAAKIRLVDKLTKVLILGACDIRDLNFVADNNISISISSLAQLEDIIANCNKKINVHIQVNSGLNRFGIKNITEFRRVLELCKNNKFITIEGVYSHFATKSNDVEYMNKQFLRFLQFKKIVKLKNVIFHIANSYATISSNKYHLDMVRTGFLLYGQMSNNIGNKPVISISSKIVNITQVKRGDSIGYDRTYRVNSSMKIAVVPIGYADGLNRKVSNKFSVIIKDTLCPIVGLVCMDVFMVDVSKIQVQVGDKVTILGESATKEITLNDYAKCVETSPYEVLCNFNYKRMNYNIKK